MPPTHRVLVVARLAEVGQAEAARRVAPLWGWQPRDAEARLSRFKGGANMPADALFALLVALDLTITKMPQGLPRFVPFEDSEIS